MKFNIEKIKSQNLSFLCASLCEVWRYRKWYLKCSAHRWPRQSQLVLLWGWGCRLWNILNDWIFTTESIRLWAVQSLAARYEVVALLLAANRWQHWNVVLSQRTRTWLPRVYRLTCGQIPEPWRYSRVFPGQEKQEIKRVRHDVGTLPVWDSFGL